MTILLARRRLSVQTLQMVRMSTPISSACERMRTLSVRYRFGLASAMSPAPQQVAAGIGSSSMSSIGARYRVVASSSLELNSAMQPG